MSTLLLNLLLLISLNPVNSPNQEEVKYELPNSGSPCQLIIHQAYTLCYAEKYEQARWVAYSLTKEHSAGGEERTNKFIEDPLVTTGTATNKDYAGSGYDKGHLAPAADMGWSPQTMAESFYFSNMSPQVPAFNRGIWKKLEEQVRQWAKDYDKIYIATGPILRNGLPVIGKDNAVAVPEYYYKVILDYTQPELKAIGFILPNKASNLPLSSFTVSVDSVESLTGIDFFYQVPKEIQEKLESKADTTQWIWDAPKKRAKKTMIS